MAESIGNRIKKAWSAFMNKDPTRYISQEISYASRPDRHYAGRGNERSIITSVYNRISMDVASVSIRHVRLDDKGRFSEEIKSGLNECLTQRSNIDQTGRSFIQDLVMSMLDEGVVAAVPVETDVSPEANNSYDILQLRSGKILEWMPDRVKLNAYDERTGRRADIFMEKKAVALIENPFYSVMNEPNSTMQRLIHKLRLLDSIDEQAGSGKLDLIIQLPYVIKSEARKAQADERRKEIVRQLKDSTYGIAYTDGTEKITQLNRSIDNNLMAQIEYLQKLFYSQLGVTEEILNGTADEKAMLNYETRIIEPILSAIVDEFRTKFLTKTARSQNQTIMFFREPFRLVPVSSMAEIADKFIRNEIITPNEFRQILGYKPAENPSADELRNPNMPAEGAGPAATGETAGTDPRDEIVNEVFGSLETQITDIIKSIMGDEEEGDEDVESTDSEKG